ncbi:DEAD/DEAH box helicase [Kineococcus indalonis]|uniref:DEAD/DEAH box helicase n=1 Tax=Kineococcus indalonis TaxID=2696566 RepID=UPI0014131D27|nr:DEAD/DEAH box helicase [Kineococcus indalonis]NAZ87541.1 ATP-dependent helicase [Kineococcus indalonis]
MLLRPVAVPVVDLRGDAVPEVLAEVLGEGPGPAAALAGDGLRWLAHVARGARAAVDAGSVVPTLAPAAGDPGGEPLARWAPLPDKRFHRWRSTLADLAPAVLRCEEHPARGGPPAAAALVEEVATAVADLLVSRRTAHVRPGDAALGPGPAAWVRALATGGAVPEGAQPRALAHRVRDWHRSADDAGYDLVLRVLEPPGEDERWRLQARLRPVDDPSLVLTLEQVRAESGAGGPGGGEDPLLLLMARTARAAAAHPPLKRLLAGAGDADVEVGAEDLLDLVEVGGPELAAAGVALQLPRHWTRRPVGLSLHAGAAQPGAVTNPRLRRADLVAFEWRAALGGAPVTEAELLALAASREPLVRFRGEWVQVDREALRRSALFLRRRGRGTATVLDLLTGLGADRDLPAPVTGVHARGALGEVLAGEAEAHVAPLPDPPGLRAQLRPYQRRGVAWLAAMARLGLGAVLADDMGLGKTVQLLALELHERTGGQGDGGPGGDGQVRDGQVRDGQVRDGQVGAHRPTLLVCPTSLVGNWWAEAARFTPGLRVHVHHGPDRPRGEHLARTAARHDLVVTTYGLLVRDAADLAAVRWRRLVLDEAQHVKNVATRAARAVRAVPAEHRVALTGTPVENRLEDLRAVLDATNPGLLGSAASFRDTFAVPVEKLGHTAPARRLALVTRPFVLRRLKTDPAVAPDLPERLEMTVRANLTPEQAALYRAVLDRVLARLADADDRGRRGLVLSALTRLAQVCNHPAHYLGDGSGVLHRGRHRSGKLEVLDGVVGTALAEGEKVLCFTRFAEFGHLLAPHLSELTGRRVPFLHGGLTRARRDALVAEFARDDGPPVLVLSLRAAGTGLNLTAASHVVHLDRWWNPAVEDQATDRAHRIGQRRTVQVRTLVSAGTVEEKVDEVIARKRELAGSVVGGGERWITELDDEALHELLRLGADAVGD